MNSAPRVRSIVKRTTLIVRDMEKSRRWYEYVLGMKAWIACLIHFPARASPPARRATSRTW